MHIYILLPLTRSQKIILIMVLGTKFHKSSICTDPLGAGSKLGDDTTNPSVTQQVIPSTHITYLFGGTLRNLKSRFW